MTSDIEKAIKHFTKRNFWLKANPVCQRVQKRVDKQNYEIQRNVLAISALEKQLSNGWIPVSERLPEVCGLGVLLTIENKFQQRKVIQGFTGYMEMGKLEFHTNDKCTNLEVWNVIA